MSLQVEEERLSERRSLRSISLSDIGVLISHYLGLTPYAIHVSIPCTDLDVVGLRDDDVVIIEVKRALGEWNYERTLRQLVFRKLLANEVYLAVHRAYTWYALTYIPEEYGIISFTSSRVRIVRKARRRSRPPYRELILFML